MGEGLMPLQNGTGDDAFTCSRFYAYEGVVFEVGGEAIYSVTLFKA